MSPSPSHWAPSSSLTSSRSSWNGASSMSMTWPRILRHWRASPLLGSRSGSPRVRRGLRRWPLRRPGAAPGPFLASGASSGVEAAGSAQRAWISGAAQLAAALSRRPLDRTPKNVANERRGEQTVSRLPQLHRFASVDRGYGPGLSLHASAITGGTIQERIQHRNSGRTTRLSLRRSLRGARPSDARPPLPPEVRTLSVPLGRIRRRLG